MRRLLPDWFPSRDRNVARDQYNLGLAAYKQGSPESAIIFFKRACDIDPNLADARYNLALVQSCLAVGGEAINYARVLEFERDGTGGLVAALVEIGSPGEKGRQGVQQ